MVYYLSKLKILGFNRNILYCKFIPFKMYAIICISVVALISDILFIFNHKKLSYLILGLLFPVTALIIGIKINYINEKIGYKEHEKKMKYKIPKEITDKLYKK